MDRTVLTDITTAIAERYPLLIVRTDLGGVPDDDAAVIDVFGVTPESGRRVRRFLREKLHGICESAGVPRPVVVLHSISAMEEHYPEMLEALIARSLRHCMSSMALDTSFAVTLPTRAPEPIRIDCTESQGDQRPMAFSRAA